MLGKKEPKWELTEEEGTRNVPGFLGLGTKSLEGTHMRLLVVLYSMHIFNLVLSIKAGHPKVSMFFKVFQCSRKWFPVRMRAALLFTFSNFSICPILYGSHAPIFQ